MQSTSQSMPNNFWKVGGCVRLPPVRSTKTRQSVKMPRAAFYLALILERGGYPLQSPSPYTLWFALRVPEAAEPSGHDTESCPASAVAKVFAASFRSERRKSENLMEVRFCSPAE